ncbi:chemotaxis protein CheX [Clostridia bacterium]|nr:chemotaxis protein CheX [Clostridia bacterium]
MKSEYINPFIQGAQDVFSTVFAERPALGKLRLKKLPYKHGDLAVTIGIVGQIKGDVVYTMNETAARGIASKMMMGMPVAALDEMAVSAVAELTNMISGTTCTIFSSTGLLVDITPPKVVTGDFAFSVAPNGGVISVPLNFADGNVVEIDISVTE